MKRFILYLVSILIASQALAQYESAGAPLKYTQQKQGMRRSASNFYINLNADTTKVSLGFSNRKFVSGVTCPLSISMNDGSTFVEGDMKVWRVGLHSNNAKGISLFFDKFLLPEGGKLFVYNPSQTIVYGAFTSENNNDANQLLIRPLASDSIVVEYQEPFTAPFEADLHISLATHELRKVNDFMASNECTPVVAGQVEAETLKRAVCLLYMVGETQSFWGSGALINNAQHKPYVYTAGHNLETASLATKTVYYFNYEVPTQDDTFQGSRQFTISGSTLLSRDSNIDFSLAELNKMPPADYRPYLAGWTRNTPKAPYMCIQHPYGDIKKVSYASEQDVSSYDDGRYGIYWWVKRWQNGITESGSSGSPLFDADGYIVGNLTGGNSFCNTPINDYFCQFTASWDYFSDKSKQLACHISPANADVMSMEGYDPYLDLEVKRISNIKNDDAVALNAVENSPLVGHTNYKFTKFAEKFVLENPVCVYGVYIMPMRGKYDVSNPITLEIYSGVDAPETLLSSAIVHPTEANFYRNGNPFEKDILDLKKQEIYVPLQTPIIVKDNLFVVLGVEYENVTTKFAMSSTIADNRLCTAYFYDGLWKPFTEHPSGKFNLSIWVDPVVGKVKNTSIDEFVENQSNFVVYPNPTKGEVFVAPSFDGEYKLFDMSGKMVGAGTSDFKINIPEKGFYILELLSNSGETETHKIICH